MVLAAACFVLNDAVMKTFAGELLWYEALTWRGPFAIGFSLLMCVLIDGRHAVASSGRALRNGPALLRIGGEIGSTSFFLVALFAIPLADVTAITQTLPLLLTLGGAVVFREAVGWRRWTAALVGFAGVLLIVQPGTGAFQWAAVWALVSTLCMATRDLATKAVPAAIASTTLNLVTNIAVWLFAAALALPGGLPPIGVWDAARLLLSALFITSGFLTIILAMRVGEASVVAPFRYTSLLWALAIGWALFGEAPGPWKLLGAAIVAGAGLYTFRRERRSRRNASIARDSAAVSSSSQVRKA